MRARKARLHDELQVTPHLLEGVSMPLFRPSVSGVDRGRFHKTMLNNFISPLRRPSWRVAATVRRFRTPPAQQFAL